MKTSYPILHRGRMKDGRSSDDSPQPGAKVEVFNGITRMDMNPDRVLAAAMGEMQDVVVIGWDRLGAFYIGSSHASGPDLLWLLEKARAALMAPMTDSVSESG